jgi:hypothetical protein
LSFAQARLDGAFDGEQHYVYPAHGNSLKTSVCTQTRRGPRRIRTFDLRIKSPLLYQTELAAQLEKIPNKVPFVAFTNLKQGDQLECSPFRQRKGTG